MNDLKSKELELKLENFDKYVENCFEGEKDYYRNSLESGEYNYLIESHCFNQDSELSEELFEYLEKSTLTKDQLFKKIIEDQNFEMEYEELSSPFQYGGSKENEFYTLPWGGDRECQIDRDHIQEFLPSFNLKEEFESYSSFEEFVNLNFGRSEHLKKYWEFATTEINHSYFRYNTDYDLVRVIIKDEVSLIEFLKENKKPEEKFVPRKLKVTMEEYNDLRSGYDGFCVKCGKINEGNHEPDAENYECNHCEESQSFGVEVLFMNGTIEIVDSEDESTLDESY